MIYGGLIGSNIFNVLSIVGLTAIVKPILVDDAVNSATVLMFTVSAIFVFAVYINYRFTKMAGLLMLCLYGFYTVCTFVI